MGAFFDGGSFLSTWVRPISRKITVFNSPATEAVVSCRICIDEFFVISGFIFIALTRARYVRVPNFDSMTGHRIAGGKSSESMAATVF